MTNARKAAFSGRRGEAAAALFSYLAQWGESCCVVGIAEDLPEKIPGDLDIVVASGLERAFAVALGRFCNDRGFRLVQALQHEPTATYYAFCWRDGAKKLQFLHPDVCSDYLRRGRRFLTAREILAGAELARDANGNARSFSVPAPASEFLYYLLKRIDKGSLGAREEKHLSAQWQSDPTGAARQVRRFWPGPVGGAILEAAEKNTWEKVRADLPRLQKELRAHAPLSLSLLGQVVARAWQRFFRPTGFWVVFLGPDGVGKTSVLRRVGEDLAPAFRREAYFHLRPHLGRGAAIASGPVTDPHGADPRGHLLSTAKLFYFLFDYVFGYAFRLHPKLVRSTLVLFDRYFHDLLVDPKRYRYGGAMWLARLFGAILPRPDLWVVLDAPAEVVVARKGEVPLAEAARQREAYRSVTQRFSDVALVDASQPLETVVRDVESHILDRLEKRTRGRFGLEPF